MEEGIVIISMNFIEIFFSVLQVIISHKSYRHNYIRIINLILKLQNTVKPVYNDHPWGLKNMVVMQRVVWNISVISEVEAGRCSFMLAVVDCI
jgi:hypothetical protein